MFSESICTCLPLKKSVHIAFEKPQSSLIATVIFARSPQVRPAQVLDTSHRGESINFISLIFYSKYNHMLHFNCRKKVSQRLEEEQKEKKTSIYQIYEYFNCL